MVTASWVWGSNKGRAADLMDNVVQTENGVRWLKAGAVSTCLGNWQSIPLFKDVLYLVCTHCFEIKCKSSPIQWWTASGVHLLLQKEMQCIPSSKMDCVWCVHTSAKFNLVCTHFYASRNELSLVTAQQRSSFWMSWMLNELWNESDKWWRKAYKSCVGFGHIFVGQYRDINS